MASGQSLIFPEPVLSPDEARTLFGEEFDQEPEEWMSAWKAGSFADTAENNRTAIRALTIMVNSDSTESADHVGAPVLQAPEPR
jgi:hypothetical protein